MPSPRQLAEEEPILGFLENKEILMTAPNNPTPSQPLSEQTEVQSQHRVNKSMTALGITGLVLSSIAVLISWVPIVNNFAAILGAIALPFAIAGIVATRRKGKRTGRGIAIAATILAILSIVVTLATQGMYSKAIDDTFGTTNSSTQSSTKGKTQAKGSENTKSADKEGDIDSGNYHIKLVSVTKSSNDYEGKPTAILTYELTNKKNENSNFMDVDIQAFQNGHELDTAIYMDQPEGYDAESSTQTIQPGTSKTVTVGYVLEDEISPVSIEASGTLDMSDAKVTGEFSLQ